MNFALTDRKIDLPWIWCDADACPKSVKEILYRLADRTQIPVVLVANTLLTVPRSLFIKAVKVSSGFDKADHYIIQYMQARDLVITADVPFAKEVIDKKGSALNPRGTLYTVNNIKQKLAIRDNNEMIRSSGINIGGPDKLGIKEIHVFACALDKWCAQLAKKVER